MQPEKPMKESFVEMTEIVLPNDANLVGTAFGGKIAQWVDIAASVAAIRHARTFVVTASMGQLDFITPVKVGHIVILRAQVVAVGKTSMEVEVDIYSEEPPTGRRQHTATALVTSVAIDTNGKKIEVPRLRAETDEEKKRMEIGQARIAARKPRPKPKPFVCFILALLLFSTHAFASPGFGSLEGKVSINGGLPSPIPQTITMDSDTCGAGPKIPETFMGDKHGGLGNVVALLEPEHATDKLAPATAVMDQEACAYAPHILIVPVGRRGGWRGVRQVGA